jgi:hypothetical protein
VTYGIEPGTGSGLLLRWLARPYDPERTTAALLGLAPRVTRQLLATILAISDEAEGLLGAMPEVLRSLMIATTDRPTRCVGEIRGPILWGETVAARAASAGDPGLFVCATTTRSYDTDQNRVLAGALEIVARTGRLAGAGIGLDMGAGDVAPRARHNGRAASRFLEHPALNQVKATRPTGRELKRVRAGSRRRTYGPALALLRRAAEPLGPALLHAFADARTRAQHDLLAAVLLQVESTTGRAPTLTSEGAALTSGPVRFRHPGSACSVSSAAGITIEDVWIDVPDPLDSDPPRLPPSQGLLTAARDKAVLARAADDVQRAVALALGTSVRGG